MKSRTSRFLIAFFSVARVLDTLSRTCKSMYWLVSRKKFGYDLVMSSEHLQLSPLIFLCRSSLLFQRAALRTTRSLHGQIPTTALAEMTAILAKLCNHDTRNLCRFHPWLVLPNTPSQVSIPLCVCRTSELACRNRVGSNTEMD